MMELLGLPLQDVLKTLAARGVKRPEIITVSGRNPTERGEERVIRIRENGRELTVARFPVLVEAEPPGSAWLS